jgi:hypothetical protein
MTNEEINKTLDEEEKKMRNELEATKRNFSSLANIEEPNKEDQEEKLEKFRSYLVSDFKKFSTPQLLSQIVEIINSTYVDEVKIRNETENHYLSDEMNDEEENPNNVENDLTMIKNKEINCYK